MVVNNYSKPYKIFDSEKDSIVPSEFESLYLGCNVFDVVDDDGLILLVYDQNDNNTPYIEKPKWWDAGAIYRECLNMRYPRGVEDELRRAVSQGVYSKNGNKLLDQSVVCYLKEGRLYHAEAWVSNVQVDENKGGIRRLVDCFISGCSCEGGKSVVPEVVVIPFADTFPFAGYIASFDRLDRFTEACKADGFIYVGLSRV